MQAVRFRLFNFFASFQGLSTHGHWWKGWWRRGWDVQYLQYFAAAVATDASVRNRFAREANNRRNQKARTHSLASYGQNVGCSVVGARCAYLGLV